MSILLERMGLLMRHMLLAGIVVSSVIVGCVKSVDTPHYVVVSGNGINRGQPILAIRLRDDCRCSVWYVDEKGGMIGDEVKGTLAKGVNDYFKARLSSSDYQARRRLCYRRTLTATSKLQMNTVI
jgi:hypothetical protein